MTRKALILTLCLTALVYAQEQRQPPREAWNEIFTKRQGREFPHNTFLAEMVKGRKPGKALDIGIGEGRNALFLASQGWEVTGFDISDVGVKLAREEAQKRGLKLEALVADVDSFDYGKQRWDLVVGMYMHELITRNANKIIDSLKPGGIILIEGFHRDLNVEKVGGGALGYNSNELLREFDRLRVLYYEDTIATADWGRGQPKSPIVRFLARKDQTAGNSP
jgi:SAM-dependent methyltransferase